MAFDINNPPKTVEEIGVHLMYLSRTVVNIEGALNDSKTGLLKRMDDAEETIAPLARIRQKMWSIAIGGVFSVAALTFLATWLIKTNITEFRQ